MFIDLSLQVNTTDKLNYDRWAYLETEENSSINIKVFEWIGITTDFGYEGWKSLKDDSPYYYGNFTLKPGWQVVEFEHYIGYA